MFEEGKICFCLGGWRKKGEKIFRDRKYGLEEDVLVDLKRHFSSPVEVPPPSY